MAEKLGIDSDMHELKLGSSFETGSSSKDKLAFHSLRYDFKPASVDTSQVASVEIGESHSVSVTLPHVEGSGTSQTVYKGNKRPCQKECVLIIDHKTGTFTLEKLSNNIQLKKTRCYMTEGGEHGWHGDLGRDDVGTSPSPAECDSRPDQRPAVAVGASKSALDQIRPRLDLALRLKQQEAEKRNNDIILLSRNKNSTLCSTQIARIKELQKLESGCLPQAVLRRTNFPPTTSQSEQEGSPGGCPSRSFSDIVQFASGIEEELRAFLQCRPKQFQRETYVSCALEPALLESRHPVVYQAVLNRLKMSDRVLDELYSYLLETHGKAFTLRDGGVHGCVQRLEQLVDFILVKYKQRV